MRGPHAWVWMIVVEYHVHGRRWIVADFLKIGVELDLIELANRVSYNPSFSVDNPLLALPSHTAVSNFWMTSRRCQITRISSIRRHKRVYCSVCKGFWLNWWSKLITGDSAVFAGQVGLQRPFQNAASGRWCPNFLTGDGLVNLWEPTALTRQ